MRPPLPPHNNNKVQSSLVYSVQCGHAARGLRVFNVVCNRLSFTSTRTADLCLTRLLIIMGYRGVALTTVSAAESTSHFERRPQIPCRVFADPPGRRGGGGIGSSAVHTHTVIATPLAHDLIGSLTGGVRTILRR